MKTEDKVKAIDYALDNIIINEKEITKWENIRLDLDCSNYAKKKGINKISQEVLCYFKTLEKTNEAIDFFISDVINTGSCIDFWKKVKDVYKYNQFDGLPPKEYLSNENLQ